MKYLSQNFKIISLSDFYEAKIGARNMPENVAMVTFDDGYEDNYTYAFPMLKDCGISATIFICTGFVDKEVDIAKRDSTYSGLKPLTWEQIAEMRDYGVSFGAHTHTHQMLTHIPIDKAEIEITKSKEILERHLNSRVETFAFPIGQPNTFNKCIIALLKKHGFKLACSTVWGHDNHATDRFALRRIRIDAVDTLDDFKAKIRGDWGFVRWVQILKGQKRF